MKSLLFILLIAPLNLLYSQWNQIYYTPEGCLKDVIFVNENIGFAVNGFTIIKTENAGTTWTVDDSHPGGWTDIDFPSTDTGFVCCGSLEGNILYSYDQGTTWNYPISDFGSSFMQGEFLKNGVAVMTQPFADFSSFDRIFEYWGSILIDTMVEGITYDIVFPSQDTGFISGDLTGGSIYKTSNGGETWHSINAVGSPKYSLSFPSSLVGFAIDEYNSLQRTIDGGETWEKIPYVFDGSLNKIYFYSSWLGFATVIKNDDGVFKGKVIRTVDGGDSWTVTDFSDDDDYEAFGYFCTDSNTCFLITCHKIYKTSNGGGIGDAISDFNSKIEFYLTPNPTTNSIKLAVNTETEIKQIITTNCLGIRIFINWNNNLEADIQSLSSGIYFTEIITEQGKEVKKWIKN